jgi:hypothetical protein
MQTKLHTLLVGASCALLPVSAFAQIDFDLNFLGGTQIANGAEILSYHAATGSVLTTYSSQTGGHGIQIYSLGSNGALTASRQVDLGSVVGGTTYSLSSVVADSMGRDFGVATLIPGIAGINEDGDAAVISNSEFTGKAVFFRLSTGAALATVDVGYHPDSVTITPDGNRIVIANEAEYALTAANPTLTGLAQRNGSVSVINLTGVSDLSTVNSSHVTTTDFSASNLASGVSLAGLRNNDSNLSIESQVEPEYITTDNSRAYVSLQENNAVAVLDFATGKFTAINSLGTIDQRVDGSDRDPQNGGTSAVNVNDTVAGMPMPDTIAKFSKSGNTYLLTANEGDARIDGGDEARAGASGITDAVDNGSGDLFYGGSLNNSSGIGRLNISRVDGNLDADAGIERPTMFGTRSFSIVDPATGDILYDSGSAIEDFIAANDITTFGISSADLTIDGRSDNKGPEPEAIAYGSINGRDYAFVGAERTNGIFQFDITDALTNPNSVSIVGYYNPVTGENGGASYFAPESILFLGAGTEGNISGKDLLVVGFEVSGSIAVLEVSAIPEPSAAAALAGAGVLGLAALRRRRSSR